MDEISKLRSRKGYLYAGFPKFMALFGRDSLISSWELAGLDSKIGLHTLEALSELQGKKHDLTNGEEEGKIPHEFYDDNKIFEMRKRDIPWLVNPNYFSVDSTPLYFIVMEEIERVSGNNLHGRFVNNILRAYNFLIANEIINDLARYFKAMEGRGLQSQSWRDGAGEMLDKIESPVAVVGVQGYAYAALKYLERLSGEINGIDRGLILEKEEKLSQRLRDEMWLEDSSYFALATGGNGEVETAITSDPGHLLFSGILRRKEERDIVDALFDKGLFTDYGIRTLSSQDKRFDPFDYQRGSIWPNDNWIIALGLKLRGYQNEYRKLREAVINAYEKIGFLPEYYSVDRAGNIIPIDMLKVRPCYPQAWSTGAIINLLGEP